MATTMQKVPPIPRGYRYVIQIEATPIVAGDPPAFPAGCALLAEVRDHVGAPEVRLTLRTEDGTIERLGDNIVELRLPGIGTAKLAEDAAALDLVRTDPSPDVWLGIQVILPVAQPVTAPTEDA